MQSSEAESKGAIKRGQLVMIGSNTAKIVDSQCVEGGFSYYVTFLSLNRRMDRWVSQNEIDSQIEKAEIPQQEIDLFQNDENKGMDEKQVEEHENSTKIKTIDYVQMSKKVKIRTWYFSPLPIEL